MLTLFENSSQEILHYVARCLYLGGHWWEIRNKESQRSKCGRNLEFGINQVGFLA